MWYWTLINILLKALPLERIVAQLFNRVLDKYLADPQDVQHYETAIKAAQRIHEQVAITLSALEDRHITSYEVTQAGVGVIRKWAMGEVADKLDEAKALRK